MSCYDVQNYKSKNNFNAILSINGKSSWYTLPCGILDPVWLKNNNLKGTSWDWSMWGCNSNSEGYGYKSGIGYILRRDCPISCGICDFTRNSYLFDIWNNDWNGKEWAFSPLPQNFTWQEPYDSTNGYNTYPIPFNEKYCECK